MFGKIAEFFAGAKVELKKVSWPTKNELKDSTVVVIVSVLMLAFFVGVVDLVLSKIVELVIK